MIELVRDLVKVIEHIFSPGTLVTLITLSGLLYKAWKFFIENITEKLDERLEEVDKRLKSLEETSSNDINELGKEILRLQILEGIHTERLSQSELLYFADKYHALGGNSFVSEKIDQYVEKLERGN